VIGTVSLSGILAACGDDSGKGEVATTDGTTTPVQAKTKTSRVTAGLFDASSSCSLTPEETEGPWWTSGTAMPSASTRGSRPHRREPAVDRPRAGEAADRPTTKPICEGRSYLGLMTFDVERA
jgi:hypothetical protein